MFQFSSVRSRFVAWFLLVALTPLLSISALIYAQRSQALKRQQFEKLIAIRDLKVDRLNTWLAQRQSDMRIIARADEIRHLVEAVQANRTNDIPALSDAARAVLTRHQTHYTVFAELSLVHADASRVDDFGRVAVSTSRSSEGALERHDRAFTHALRAQDLYIQDIFYCDAHHKPEMTYSLPVFAENAARAAVFVLIARVNLERTIYPLLLNRTGMGQTGETLIVNHDVVALNELRWHENAPAQLQIRAKPAILASQGQTGITETDDYRMEPVLAAYTYLPSMRWGLVAKQDLAEIYRPITVMLWQMLLMVSAATAAVVIVAFVAANSIARPITHMRLTSRKIADGNLSVRYQFRGQDEFRALARSLNQMTDALALRMAVESASAALSDVLVGIESMTEFHETVTRHLVDLTGSQVAVMYAEDADAGVFRPVFSLGADSARLRDFPAGTYDGDIGHALARQTILHTTDIPPGSVLNCVASVGTFAPGAILTIPVLDKGRVSAVLSLARLRAYTAEHLEIVRQNHAALNTKYASLRTADTVVALAQELDVKNQELQIQTQELQVQAQELHQQNQELERRSRQVEDANRLKSEFLSNMSHELRTPLNSVIALSRVLMMQAKTSLSDEEFGYLEIIARNGKHLLELINDILDISKIEAGKIEIAEETFAIGDVVQAVEESLRPLAEEKGVRLTAALPDDMPMLVSDYGKVRQILQNIVGNAVKFTMRGCVEIQGRHADDNVVIAVKDSGVGIPAGALPHIFEEFRQVDGSTSRSYEGTGLGLSIALRHARLLGGRIEVESVLGEGSVFTVTLPVHSRTVRASESGPDAARPLAASRPDGGALDGARLLLVEDSEAAVIQIRHILTRAGYALEVARAGRDAVEAVERAAPDGIILDLMMPGIDGFEVLNRIRRNPATSAIPVLVLTAKDLTPDDEQRLNANHIQQLIRKGDVDQEALLSTIRQMLSPGPQPAPAEAPAAAETPGPRLARERPPGAAGPPTILMIDDHADTMTTLRAILRPHYAVLEAADGESGLELARAKQPDAILLDLSLPEMDGFQVAASLKHHPATRHLPVIALTARAMKGDREKALDAGCHDYLSKPVEPDTLLACLRKWVPGRGTI